MVESLRGAVENKHVLLVRAKVARDLIPRELRKMGARVEVIEAYETMVPASSKKRLQSVIKDPELRPDLVTFTSSSTVRNFAALLGWRRADADLSGIQFASIGPITSATLREFGFPVHLEARTYTIPGLVQSIVKFATKASF
jgi:uroporphyrinogen-III synthase